MGRRYINGLWAYWKGVERIISKRYKDEYKFVKAKIKLKKKGYKLIG